MGFHFAIFFTIDVFFNSQNTDPAKFDLLPIQIDTPAHTDQSLTNRGFTFPKVTDSPKPTSSVRKRNIAVLKTGPWVYFVCGTCECKRDTKGMSIGVRSEFPHWPQHA